MKRVADAGAKVSLLTLCFLLVVPGTIEAYMLYQYEGFYISVPEVFSVVVLFVCLALSEAFSKYRLAVFLAFSVLVLFSAARAIVGSNQDLHVEIYYSTFALILSCGIVAQSITRKEYLSFLIKCLKFVVYANFIYVVIFSVIVPNILAKIFPQLMALRAGYQLEYLSSGIVFRVQSLLGSANTTSTLVSLVAISVLIAERGIFGRFQRRFQAVAFLLIVLTLSRTGLIVYALSFTILNPKLLKNVISTRRGFAVCMVLTAIITSSGMVQSFVERLQSEGATSITARGDKLENATSAINESEYLVLGNGVGTAESRNQAILYSLFLVPDSSYEDDMYAIGESENFALVLFYEVGALGLVLFLLMFIPSQGPVLCRAYCAWFIPFFSYINTESSFKMLPFTLVVVLTAQLAFAGLSRKQGSPNENTFHDPKAPLPTSKWRCYKDGSNANISLGTL